MTKRITLILGMMLLIGGFAAKDLIWLNLRADDPLLAGWQEYSVSEFDQLAQTDQPVLIEVYASWCPTCFAQHRAMEELWADGKARDLPALRVDFDRNKDFLAQYQIRATGHMMVFKQGKPVARAAGLTDAAKIEQFLRPYLEG